MALIKCKECGKEISDKAKNCPYCGYKDKTENTNKYSGPIRVGSIVSLIANVLIVLIVVWLFTASAFPAPPSSTDNGGLTISVSGTPETISLIYGIFMLISIILAIVCTIWVIIFLCNKIKNIKVYKSILLIASIIEFVLSMWAINGFVCCGMIYAIFPLINLIGAIIVATGKIK